MTTSTTTSPTTNNIYLNNYKPDYQHQMAKYHGNIMEMTTIIHCNL